MTLRLMLALSVASFPLALAECGGSSGGDTSPPWDVDPNVPPVTSGNWYRPDVNTTWQLQLQGTLNTRYGVDVYDIDLFDTSVDKIRQIQASGAQVICYFSAGSAEEWRDDYDQFAETDLGKPLYGWPGEYWVDIRSANVLDIMLTRMDLAVDKGCDGVDPDNVNAFANPSGFDLTASDQLAYNKRLANEAHTRGLSVGLKNDVEQIDALVDYYDFQVNEECHTYDECSTTYPFVDSGKPVFNAEYADTAADANAQAVTLCPEANREDLRTLIMPLALDDSFRVSCDY